MMCAPQYSIKFEQVVYKIENKLNKIKLLLQIYIDFNILKKNILADILITFNKYSMCDKFSVITQS